MSLIVILRHNIGISQLYDESMCGEETAEPTELWLVQRGWPGRAFCHVAV